MCIHIFWLINTTISWKQASFVKILPLFLGEGINNLILRTDIWVILISRKVTSWNCLPDCKEVLEKQNKLLMNQSQSSVCHINFFQYDYSQKRGCPYLYILIESFFYWITIFLKKASAGTKLVCNIAERYVYI